MKGCGAVYQPTIMGWHILYIISEDAASHSFYVVGFCFNGQMKSQITHNLVRYTYILYICIWLFSSFLVWV